MNARGNDSARVRAVEQGVPDGAWRRVHPISPALNAWKALAALLAIIVYQNADVVSDVLNSEWAHERGAVVIVLFFVAGLVVFVLLAGLYSWLAWRATSYAVTDSAVWFRSGVLFRSQRHARLDRIQAVDVIHPLLGRLFGLGRLSVEVAGGAGSNLVFGYLSTTVLEDLRAEILARAAGLKVARSTPTSPIPAAEAPLPVPTDEGGAARVDSEGGAERQPPVVTGEVPPAEGAAHPEPTGPRERAGFGRMRAGHPPAAGDPARAPRAQEHELYSVPVGRLLGSMLISLGTLFGVLGVLAIVVGVIVATVVWGPGSLTGLFASVPAVLGLVSFVWGRFSGEFNFTAAVSPDGIRIRRGLTETRSQTIPPRRVHAVRVMQPFLWRRMGWYRVTITQAGYAGEGGESGNNANSSSDVLLPVGTREQAELAVWLVVRDLGVEDPHSLLEAGLSGVGDGSGFVANPRRSRVLDPVAWRRRAVALTRTCLVVRDGRVTRTLTVAPVERLQSVGVEQGPWLRHLDLATLHMHIVPGSVHAHAPHVDAAHARELLGEVLELGRVRRGSEPPEKWMLRVAEVVPDPGVREAIVEDAGAGEGAVGPGTLGEGALGDTAVGGTPECGAGASRSHVGTPPTQGSAPGDPAGEQRDVR
ncbi:MAG: PH domain-containing protein [Propionibacterium sp.]|nr:PH domain-containing protein [Propionibacterium sp.]